MPKYNSHDEEVLTKDNTLDEASNLIKENNKNKIKNNDKNIVKPSKKELELEEKEKEDRENFEIIVNDFMDYWYDRSVRHPGILYHLSKSEALVGFELYYSDRKKFIRWSDKNTKPRVRAPYPYNLPSIY